MLNDDLQPQTTRRGWLLGVMALALAAVLGATASRLTPRPVAERLGVIPEDTVSPATQTPSAGALHRPSPTPESTPLPPPFPDPPPREDHYWLERPIAPSGTDWIDYSYPYGSRGDGTLPIHRGVEFLNPIGTPILAAADGTVSYAGSDDEETHGARENYYGLVVIIELDRTLDGHPVYTVYGHLSELTVASGQRVETGDVVGYVGMTGVALGPHLHMEVRVGRNEFSATVNPELWLRPFEGKGTLAAEVLLPDGSPAPGVAMRVVRADQPNVPVREVTTYPELEVNPDPYWGENMVCGDLHAGSWLLQALRSGHIVSAPFTIEEGKTTWLTMRAP